MSLTSGTRLGTIEILRPLGTGGSGDVYLALDRQLNRHVAVKLLRPDLSREARDLTRFEQEARAASSLSHPNICHIYHMGDTPEGRRYIAMEYVEGETLAERLSGRRPTLREALDVAIQIASALTAAHAAGIVHRDIKPGNVVVRRDHLVKVLDFGLAKLAPSAKAFARDGSTESMPATEPGALVGTLDYMSPEQVRGQEVDARADIWSLGVVIYEMVAGRLPFTGPSRADALAAILNEEPPPLSRTGRPVPAELQRIIGRALRKDPERRYQVLKDLLLDLEALRDELTAIERDTVPTGGPALPGSGTAPQVSSADHRWRRRRRQRLAAGLAVLIIALPWAAWQAWQTRTPRGDATTAESGHQNNYGFTGLTFGPGLQTDPAFSPDGRFIAFASDRAGNFDIWVQALSGRSDAMQVTKSPSQDTQPAWSPDGTTLVFHSDRAGGGLFLVPAFGGAERRITSAGSHPRWSDDGSEILFFEGFLPLDWKLDNYIRLHAVRLDGERPREILASFFDGGSWRWVATHPDGRFSALGVHGERGFGFYTVARHGQGVTPSKIVPLGADPGEQPVRFQWDPSGTLLYVEAISKGTRSLWRIRVEPATLDWISAERLTTPVGRDTAATLSPDGTRLAFSRQHERSQIWAFPLDMASGRPRLAGAGRPLTEEAVVATGALSPDGQKLAYELSRAGDDRTELWVMHLDGGQRELLATDAKWPVWSRDGTTVAYNYVRLNSRPLEAATAYQRLGGTEQFLVPWNPQQFFEPADWTPDGSGLIGTFMSPFGLGGPTSIVLWSVSNPRALSPERTLMSAPDGTQLWAQNRSYSPNGRWIAFTLLNLHANRVEPYVAPASGAPRADWVRIAPGHESPDKPRWSADGKAILFISREATSYMNLWATRFDPGKGRPIGKPFALTSFDSPATVISPYFDVSELSVSPRHVAMTMLTVSGNLWMLEGLDR